MKYFLKNLDLFKQQALKKTILDDNFKKMRLQCKRVNSNIRPQSANYNSFNCCE